MLRKPTALISKDKTIQIVSRKDVIKGAPTETTTQETTSNKSGADDDHLTPTDLSVLGNPEATRNETLENGCVKDSLSPQLVLQENKIESGSLAARVVDLSFSYKKPTPENNVLKGVNMHVKKGEIYALLGPSGCGKTTLLKCFTRFFKPHTGKVLFSQDLGDTENLIGFMPQEISLFPELTIDETFWLFGRIYGISPIELQEQILKFSNIFDLPPRTRRIDQLSGGQKRRVSFISALLRDAPLLILDEPTVGLDPVLRQTIWTYLLNYTSSEKKTIILTTHYIDEAKEATTIGLMRDGKVLVEASPTTLMNNFRESSLEQCFYKICVKNESHLAAEDAGGSGIQESDYMLQANPLRVDKSYNTRENTKNSISEVDKSNSCNTREKTKQLTAEIQKPNLTANYMYLRRKTDRTFRHIGCLVTKNVKLLKRTAMTVAIQFVIPGIVIALFGICIGQNVSDLKFAVINEEDPPYFSQAILNQFNNFSIIQRNYRTLEDGIASVENGKSLVALHFQPDFSYCLLHRMSLGIFANNGTLDCSSIKLYMDTTNQILSLSAQNYIFKSYLRVQDDVLLELGAMPFVGTLPVVIETPIYGSLDIKYSDYVTPTVLLLVIHYLAAALAGINLVLERASGVFERLQIVGVTKENIFAAQMFTSCTVVVIQIIIMLIVQFSIFHTEVKGNLFYAIIIILLQGISGISFGFFISSITKDISVGLMIGMGAMYPNLVLCGFIWPLEGMPTIMRKIAYFVPLSLTIDALRSIITRGWGITHYNVCMGVLSVVGWSVVFILVGVFFYKWKK